MVSVGAYAGAECRRASRAPRASFGMIADRAYDSDRLRTALGEEGLELVCQHRRGRRRKATQDGRKLRRYRRLWIVERTISWLGQFRRLIVRHEYYPWIYQGLMHLACAFICLRKF